ncbi:MAG: putative lipid II flippase FtsW [Eubacteriales bacterium]
MQSHDDRSRIRRAGRTASAPQEAQQAPSVPAGKSGRAPRRSGQLQVRRENLTPAVRGAEENIVRVRTNADRVMLALILILLALGSIMVFSASYPSALAEKGDSLYYIKRQLAFIGLGVCVMFAASVLPPAFYRKMALPAYGLAILFLLLVFVPGIGLTEGEAKRWIWIRGTSFTFQPSEFMKVALVMALAWYLDKYRDCVLDRTVKKKYVWYGVCVPSAFVGVACLLVLMEKHLSGTMILGMIGVCVMFIAGVHPGWMAGLLGAAGVSAVSVFLALNPYALKRIITFTDEDADKLNELWQTTQGLLAIGSGGAFGVGLGASRQKYSYVSEAQNDFIFTIWCEEMGFVGAAALIILFLLFIWRGYVIAMRAPDTFSALLVFGIVSQVGIQAFLNIAVVTDVIPNTGISLPFFSYGGTSLVILMAEMGVVLSVSKHSYQKR